MPIKIGSNFVPAPISCSLAQLTMPSLRNTLRSTSAAPHIQLAYFGDDVGMGKLVNESGELPDGDTQPEAQCCFDIIEGPKAGKRMTYKRKELSVGEFRLLEPDEVRSCELCAAKQCKVLRIKPKFQMCSKCRCYYCSEECQKNDWAAHKLVCVQTGCTLVDSMPTAHVEHSTSCF
jgi:hypothetical protein